MLSQSGGTKMRVMVSGFQIFLRHSVLGLLFTERWIFTEVAEIFHADSILLFENQNLLTFKIIVTFHFIHCIF